MKFSSAATVEQVVWNMKLADYDSSYQRSLINQLAEGFPPYTEQEERENNIEVNVNFLDLTQITHDCRRQFFNAFLNGSRFFGVNLDYGAKHKRSGWSQRITGGVNKRMKRSMKYFEGKRSEHAALALHGIGPSVWLDRQKWCPTAVGIEDVLIPARTLLTMENLPFFAVFVQYTAAELYKMTHGPRPDPGWNMDLVDKSLRWADQEYRKSVSYAEQFSPEKVIQAYKENRGEYDADAVPTIDTWHFFFWDDDDKQAGWKKRIILDSPAPAQSATARSLDKDQKNIIGTAGDFLYDSGKRKYADKLEQIIHFQFGDASSVGPFRYHSVRSLGFLVYSVCHLQNRLHCAFNVAAREALMQYYRCSSPEDAERLEKVDLLDRGIIPTGVEFVKAEERWTVNEGLVGAVMGLNRQSIAKSSASYTQDFDFASKQQDKEKTATEVMAEVNATSALVGSMLNQAYAYSKWEYLEECRRFCIPNSKDPDVRSFRAEVLKAGVPEEALNVECWEVEPERVLGGGNKVLQFAQVDKLMAARPLMDPEPQREVLHDAVMVWTDDADRADRLAPIAKQQTSDSRHDAELAASTLLNGLPMTLKQGVSHVEYAGALLAAMVASVQGVMAQGGVASPDRIRGLLNLAGTNLQGKPTSPNGIAAHIQILAQDETAKQIVKQMSDVLGKQMNEIKGMVQRLHEEQARQDAGYGPNGGLDLKDIAKIKGQEAISQAKVRQMERSHSARTAEKTVSFELAERRKNQEHAAKMKKAADEHAMSMRERASDIAAKVAGEHVKTAAEIRRGRMKSLNDEPSE